MGSSSETVVPPATLLDAAIQADIIALVANSTDAVLFLDRQWRIIYANESARQLSRMEPHYLNSRSLWELYPEAAGTTLESEYRRAMDERVSLEIEFYYGPFAVWLALRVFPIPSGLAVQYRDTTRLHLAEARRDEMAGQLQQVFEVTSDAVALLDRGYNITFLNRRAREMLAPSGDVLGKNHWTCFPGTVYPGSPYVSLYHRAMEQGEPGSFEAYYGEPLNIWVWVEVRPANDGIILFFRDITAQCNAAQELERKTAEAERQAAEIETLYRTAPIGLALFDAEEFRYLRLNDRQAAFFGLKPEEIVGRTLTEMAPIPGLRELFEGVRAGTPVINYPLEGELISNPGEHRYWTVNYFPVYAPDGSIRGISAASLEITQQRKAEQALLQSEKLAAVGRLASSISHEINNPLESITNLLYLIALSEGLPEDVAEYVHLAQSELERVSQIATQTLRFHRQAVRPTLVTAAQLVEPILSLYHGRLANSGIEVVQEMTSNTPILCLENEIRQVISNLIGNAIDAMRTGGTLTLRSHDTNEANDDAIGVRITIADNGHGMSDETMKRIFEPFFTTKDLNGTGLGLWISQEIVERHNGQLTARSSQHPEHHGTVFSLFLPLAQNPSLGSASSGE